MNQTEEWKARFQDVRNDLKKFSDEPIVEDFINKIDVITSTEPIVEDFINKIDVITSTEPIVEDLVNKVDVITSTELTAGLLLLVEALDEKNKEAADSAHKLLVLLTELSPCNPKDPCTQMKINADDCVYVSTGYQFSLTVLIAYHQARNCRENSPLYESSTCKRLINPFDNLPFSIRDVKHIVACAEKKALKIQQLSIEPIEKPVVSEQKRLPLQRTDTQWFFGSQNLGASFNGGLDSEHLTLGRR